MLHAECHGQDYCFGVVLVLVCSESSEMDAKHVDLSDLVSPLLRGCVVFCFAGYLGL